MAPGRPWNPESGAEADTDCTCSLGALFLQTGCLPKLKPKPKPKREERRLGWFGKF